ncbi:MAG: thioredoxin 1 [Planctomycetota bacterium]|jgi:thioredoxin 1
MSNMIEINSENFEAEVITAGGVSLVDFSATWCGPCKALAPTIEELAGEYADRGVKIGKCDVDEAGDIAARYGIMSVPTILFFKDGEKVDTMMGNQPKNSIQAKIDALLA